MGQIWMPSSGNPVAEESYYKPVYEQPPSSSNPYEPPQSYHEPASSYKPKQNCTVKDKVLRAEICTPSFKTECTQESITVKKITEKEYCFQVAKTVCTESEETIDNEICVYEYETKDQPATAKTVKVNFKKSCNTQMVTVCDPGGYGGYHGGYHGHGYGGGYCKEVAQETCYNVPSLEPVDVEVTLTFPQPVKKCDSKAITIPRVSCEVMTEKKCIQVPEVEDDEQMVEKCQPVVGSPVCQKVELVLPKQICQDVIYGYAHKPTRSTYGH
jgi:hypothetical protein